jgi:uncharacterized membrane protein YqaE (UPF0057 family)
MKQLIKSFVAIFFPWLTLLFDDNPGGAVLALILQATVIGWIPAAMWAWQVAHKSKKSKRKKPQKVTQEEDE